MEKIAFYYKEINLFSFSNVIVTCIFCLFLLKVEVDGTNKYFIYNHLKFIIEYN